MVYIEILVTGTVTKMRNADMGVGQGPKGPLHGMPTGDL
jgi:hypothetical protein